VADVTDTIQPPEETVEAVLSAALRQRGQRVTPQRLAIARTIRDMDRHATAELLFGEVSRRMPGVSMPTVYATLELLEELNLVRRLATEAGSIVYDPRVEDHHHAICRSCGAIVDVDAPVDREAVVASATSAGFAVDGAQVIVRGLCADCRAAA
jgi:Fe2+ or Zn2+ uptake regulation protein